MTALKYTPALSLLQQRGFHVEEYIATVVNDQDKKHDHGQGLYALRQLHTDANAHRR